MFNVEASPKSNLEFLVKLVTNFFVVNLPNLIEVTYIAHYVVSQAD